jgi:hypothetical protein
MECDLKLQLKLPAFVESPIGDFMDAANNAVEVSGGATAALPLDCAPPAVKASADPARKLADAVTKEIQNRVRAAVQKEAEDWVRDTAIQTIVAAIPTGGIGGAAAMSTSIATFVYKAHNAIKPIVSFANETKAFAEDLGFSTSCGWSDWVQY